MHWAAHGQKATWRAICISSYGKQPACTPSGAHATADNEKLAYSRFNYNRGILAEEILAARICNGFADKVRLL